MSTILGAGVAVLSRGRERKPPAAALAPELEAAFSVLYEEVAVPLWRYIYRTSNDSAVADDLMQESFLRLLRRPEVLRDRSAARPYLFRIASNLLRDRWRRAERQGRLAPRSAPMTVEEGHDQRSQARRTIQAVLGGLKARERALVWLAHVEGYRHQEIADILGVKRSSVKVLLHRAKTKLLSLLAAEGYTQGSDP